MILVGNQRGGARNLAQHLMKEENERVQVHELRGFVADDLDGAFQESYAISRGTKCRQFLFSLSLNPPKGAGVSDEAFVQAVDAAEITAGDARSVRGGLGLDGGGGRRPKKRKPRAKRARLSAAQPPYARGIVTRMGRDAASREAGSAAARGARA